MLDAGDQPLSGRTIVTTRAVGQGEDFGRRLRDMGARVVPIPAIEIRPPADPQPLDAAIRRLDQYDWLILTSANAADLFFDRAGPVERVRIAVVGAQTARCVERHGRSVDVVPPDFRGESLLDEFPADLTGLSILLPRAEVADETLPETLRRRGARVDIVTAYRTVIPEDGRSELRRMLSGGAIDCITFTSGSTVRNVVTMLGEDASRLLATTVVAVIGPVTRRDAEAAGLDVRIQPSNATTSDLAEAIARYFQD
jgi:uroporphyrinogen III methyltransferase/synthase